MSLQPVARVLLVFALAFGFLLSALVAPARAQLSTSGTITGTVTDASGAVVPQATVEIINEGTGVRTSTQTNSDGSFAMPGLVVGNYTVTISKQGFQTYTEKGITLHPATVTTVNAVVKVGEVVQEITVAAAATQVQTSTNEVSSEVSQEQVETLPLNGRNYQSLSALMPGVTNTSPGQAINQLDCTTVNAR